MSAHQCEWCGKSTTMEIHARTGDRICGDCAAIIGARQ